LEIASYLTRMESAADVSGVDTDEPMTPSTSGVDSVVGRL